MAACHRLIACSRIMGQTEGQSVSRCCLTSACSRKAWPRCSTPSAICSGARTDWSLSRQACILSRSDAIPTLSVASSVAWQTASASAALPLSAALLSSLRGAGISTVRAIGSGSCHRGFLGHVHFQAASMMLRACFANQTLLSLASSASLFRCHIEVNTSSTEIVASLMEIVARLGLAAAVIVCLLMGPASGAAPGTSIVGM